MSNQNQVLSEFKDVDRISIQKHFIAEHFADLFYLLAIAFRYPSQELVQSISDGSFINNASICFHALNKEQDNCLINKDADFLFTELPSQVSMDDLCIEYTRLFLVPRNTLVPLYETQWRSENKTAKNHVLFISETCMSVERFYQSSGVKCSLYVKEPADHIATECEFLMFLWTDLVNSQDSEHVSKCIKNIVLFFNEHLNFWFEAFMKDLYATSQSSFYRCVATLGMLSFSYMKRFFEQTENNLSA